MSCCVPNCGKKNKVNELDDNGHRITFHSLPKDPELRKIWIDSLRFDSIPSTVRPTICSEHFKEDDFYYIHQGKSRRIKPKAVPFRADLPVVPITARLCKICLDLDAKMYNIMDYNLDKMYESITGIVPRIDLLGRLPVSICWECAARLSSAAAFRDKVLLSDHLLQNIVNNEDDINIDDILNLKTQHKSLKSPLVTQNLFSPIFEPSDNIKTETVEQPEHTELLIAVNDVINATEVEIKNDNLEILEDLANTDQGTVKAELLAPLTEINIPEMRDDYFYEDVHQEDDYSVDEKMCEEISENEKISITADIENLDCKEKIFDEVSTSDEKISLIVDTVLSDNRVDKNREPIVVLDKLKLDDVKKEKVARKRKIRKNYTPPTEWKGKKKQPYVKPARPLDENVITITPLSRERLLEEILIRKESIKYAMAPFKCTVCYLGFPTKDKQERHVIKHSEESGPVKCEICKIRMKLGRQMRAHINRTHAVEFSCKLCPFVTRIRNNALGHVKFHAGNKYTCNQCHQEFEKKTTLLNHLRLKHISDSVCDLCGYTFVSKIGVEAHKKMKHKLEDPNTPKTGPYCKVCEVKFLTQNAYDKHLRLSSKHIKSDNDPNRLSNDPSIKSRRLGNDNMKAVRRPVLRVENGYSVKDNKGPVTCEQCDEVLANKWSYISHFKSEHPSCTRTQFMPNVIPYMCEHCGKLFKNKTVLSGHMWVHTGEKPYQCDHCDKTFSTKSNIALHMKNHATSRRTFECPICGKHFLFLHNRTRHMFLHTGVKPFKCDICEKRFPLKCEMRSHVEYVHLNIPRPKRQRTKKRERTVVEY